MKGYTRNCTEKRFFTSKSNKTAPWNYIVEDLNEIVTEISLYEQTLLGIHENRFRVRKVLELKENEL